MEPPSVPTAELPGRRRYRVLPDRVEIAHLRRGEVRRVESVPLNDPAQTGFLRLPVLETSTGRSLRTEAFEQWAHHVKWGLEWERAYGLRKQRARPFTSLLALGGGALVTVGLLAVLGIWAARPRARINVEPTTLEAFGEVVLVVVLLFTAYHAAGAGIRAWLCRGGVFLTLEPGGMRFAPGQPLWSFDDVTDARYLPWVRLTRVRLTGNRTVWLPSEGGPLRRLDLVLAALSAPQRERLLASGSLA